jgi:hypothetical protein
MRAGGFFLPARSFSAPGVRAIIQGTPIMSTRHFLIALVATLGLGAAVRTAGAAESAGGYRLAGTVQAGTETLGFLELPDGGQVLIRKGSTVAGGGRVVALTGSSVRIQFSDKAVVLELDGLNRPAAGPGAKQVVVEGSDEDSIMVREIDVAAMDKALDAASAAKASAGNAKKPDVAADIGQRFAPIVGLPPNARVLAVNEQPVKSAAAAIAEVEKTLAQGLPVRLNLQGTDRDTRVYLMPKRD